MSHKRDIIGGTEGNNPTFKRSEEHTSELQSRPHLVCRLQLEKKKKRKYLLVLSTYPNYLSTNFYENPRTSPSQHDMPNVNKIYIITIPNSSTSATYTSRQLEV